MHVYMYPLTYMYVTTCTYTWCVCVSYVHVYMCPTLHTCMYMHVYVGVNMFSEVCAGGMAHPIVGGIDFLLNMFGKKCPSL